MRIGTACANGGRGAVPTRDWRADELAKQGRQSYLISNTTVGESRVLDADLIDEMRSRTACHDELTCSTAFFSGSKL